MVYKARNPQKFMDVSNVTVADRQGFIARGMTITPTGKRVEEHIYAHERTGGDGLPYRGCKHQARD